MAILGEMLTGGFEYFHKNVAPVKRVNLAYGPGGASRGEATITFVRADSASKAVKLTNGTMIDSRPMKVDMIVDARTATSLPPPKGLSERITHQPKPTPKSAAAKKPIPATGARGGKGGKRGGRGASKTARPAKKTAEELDSEMVDYWNTGAAGTEGEAATTAAAPANNGDAPMEDEIL